MPAVGRLWPSEDDGDDGDDEDEDDDDWDDKGQVGSCKQEDVETGIANMNWGHRVIHNTQVFLIITIIFETKTRKHIYNRKRKN